MTWPEDRKLVELELKLASLKLEFDYWRNQTAAGAALPKHHSQVRRVTRQLDVAVDAVSSWLGELKADEARLLQESRDLEATILHIHRIWDFFRSKLSQRSVELFHDYLVLADEFAWACYECALRKADPKLVTRDRIKEPPLVFLNGGSSPFAMSRGAEYEAEFVPDDDISRRQLVQLLRDLPISVIGVPWYQVCHLPDVVALGHEVGHVVEDDFGLKPRLEALLEAALDEISAPEERREGWRAWLGELFADIYGLLACGSAFASGLMDFFAISPGTIMHDEQNASNWAEHPPDALRVSFNLQALELADCPTDAETLRAAWLGRFPHHAMEAFETDVKYIAQALLTGPYPQLGGLPLTDVISFGKAQTAQAQGVVDALKLEMTPTAKIRPMVAGTRTAFERNPSHYVKSDAEALVLEAVRKSQTAAIRSEVQREEFEDADRAAGKALFAALKEIRGGRA